MEGILYILSQIGMALARATAEKSRLNAELARLNADKSGTTFNESNTFSGT
ncbi:hypothetical protein FBY31_1794 [Arthrobacter sp. SLBN-100]|nr:hypothetical protein FBY31_1794 [Arthrobacter sp. SLBN-100]